MADTRFARDYVPQPQETCTATVIGQYKRAALLFDRIWIARRDEPADFLDVPPDVTFGVRDVDSRVIRAGVEDALQARLAAEGSTTTALAALAPDIPNLVCRAVAEAYRPLGIQVVPSYASTAQFRAEYREGPAIAFQAALEQLPTVDDQNTPWAQILQFRNDADAKRKFRDLRLWLRDDWKPSSVAEATDRLAQKIDDYESAIRKHGFATTTGALSAILDWKDLPAVGSVLAAAVQGGVAAAGFVGGAIMLAKSALWVGKVRMEKEEMSRGAGREVAYIYDARMRFTTEE